MAKLFRLVKEAELSFFAFKGTGMGAFLLAAIILTLLLRWEPGAVVTVVLEFFQAEGASK